MDSWFEYLKHGLSRKLPEDQLKEQSRQRSQRASLNNLRPYLKRHWRKGVFGAVLVLISSLLTFPQPLITRYLVDDVILAHQLNLIVWVVLLMGVIKVLAMGSGAFQQFFFTRFQQEVILDIQSDLFDRTLHFPKAFFDEEETGYLMSRLIIGCAENELVFFQLSGLNRHQHRTCVGWDRIAFLPGVAAGFGFTGCLAWISTYSYVISRRSFMS